MAGMAVLARYGNVQPDVYADMDYLVAAELARRVVEMYRRDEETQMEFRLELTKAIMRSNGTRLG